MLNSSETDAEQFRNCGMMQNTVNLRLGLLIRKDDRLVAPGVVWMSGERGS